MLLYLQELILNLNEKPLLSIKDFQLNCEIVLVEGQSGSGKSLFLKSLIGLLPANWKSYQVLGKNYSEEEIFSIRGDQLLYLPQKIQMTSKTVLDEIKLPWSLKKSKQNIFSQKKLQELIETLDLPHDFSSMKIDHLSGGQEQALVFMRAILFNPHILLIDEGFSAMDEGLRRRCNEILKDWIKQADRGVLVTGHNLKGIEANRSWSVINN